MVKLYGPANGFGWKLNEVVGAQVVSVPMALPAQNAQRAFYTFMGRWWPSSRSSLSRSTSC